MKLYKQNIVEQSRELKKEEKENVFFKRKKKIDKFTTKSIFDNLGPIRFNHMGL